MGFLFRKRKGLCRLMPGFGRLPRDRPLLSVPINRNVGEEGFGDLEPWAGFLGFAEHGFDPDFEFQSHGGGAETGDVAVAADDVSDFDGLEKFERVNGDGDDPGACRLLGEDTASDIHLGHDPATENVTIRVGVRWHGESAQDEVALGQWAVGLVGHGMNTKA
jgi:hypothetical protein